MTIKIFNTLTKQIDEFTPINSNEVLIYSCGPTVYDNPHIGNWAAYIYWDTLVRALILSDYSVKRVINITDVGHLTSDGDEGDDKLEKGAAREGKTAWEIAELYTKSFLDGFKSLNLIEPSFFPKATEFIDEQLDLVRKLKNKGYTYQISDGIYYDTSKFTRYADFAGLKLDKLRAGARVDYNSEKRNTSDFALWKFTQQGQRRDMEWETPLDILEDNNPRMGFPGWAIECSAMAMKLLGNTIDIHTGGIDHIPTHHSNEIAQSEAITGIRLSNYWIHNNFITVNNAKISKSLGNGYTLKDLTDKGFSPLDFKMFVLQGHFRSQGNFTFEALQAAKNRLHNWRNAAAIRHQTHDTLLDDNEKSTTKETEFINTSIQSFVDSVGTDLGTPEALKILDEIFSNAQKLNIDEIDRRAYVKLIETIDSLLGLNLIQTTPDIDDESKKLILERSGARDKNDWQKADRIRKELDKKGVMVKDTSSGSIWEYC